MSSDSENLDYQLSLASRDGHDSEVLDLLQRGANPNHHDYPALHVACIYKRLLCAEYLIKWGASLSLTTVDEGWTALHWACNHNRMDCVKMLLDNHSPTDIKDHDGRTAVDVAREAGNNELAEFITLRYKPLSRDPLSSYPSVKQLSQLQVDQYTQLGLHFGLTEDQMGQISKQENPTAATLLTAKVKNIDLQWKQIVEALLGILEYKLAERVCREQGHNALSVSAFYNWIDFIKYLTDTGGFNPKEPVNEAGDTVLSIAWTRGHIGVIDYLVKDKGCDPDGPVNAAGDTLRSITESEVIKYLDHLRVSSSGDDSACKPCTDKTPQDCLSVNQHLKIVLADTWDLRTKWHSLGVELDIPPSKLEEIKCNQKGIVQDCFTDMLEYWLSQNPTWTTLIEALRSSVINRKDIAQKIEARSKGQESATPGGDHLNVDKHLKVVRKAIWELRAKWFNLGVELDITPTKLQEIRNDHHDTDECFTALLTHWLVQTSAPPTWTILLEALRSPPVGHGDVADQIETMLAKSS